MLSAVVETTTCAIVGGGPAGMVLGLLLARAGVDVTLLEKHGDFLRDFRGDTVHPSTLRLLDELGLWPAFDALPQSRLRRFTPKPASTSAAAPTINPCAAWHWAANWEKKSVAVFMNGAPTPAAN